MLVHVLEFLNGHIHDFNHSTTIFLTFDLQRLVRKLKAISQMSKHSQHLLSVCKHPAGFLAPLRTPQLPPLLPFNTKTGPMSQSPGVMPLSLLSQTGQPLMSFMLMPMLLRMHCFSNAVCAKLNPGLPHWGRTWGHSDNVSQ